MLTNIQHKLQSWLSSKWFFWGVIAFFVIQASWVALSAMYPQAFDEDFHYGIIGLYSHYWLPFFDSQPPNADAYGAVARDPSYLFYYILSFPNRLLTAIGIESLAAHVITLRLINVAFFASGLVLFRKVLIRAGLSRMATHTSIAIVSLIPVAVQVAGQINYDNLLVPMSALACLLSFSLIDQIKQRRIRIDTLLLLVVVCMLGTIVKYEFAPIFFAAGLYFAGSILFKLKGHWKQALKFTTTQWEQQSLLRQSVVLGIFVISALMFGQRVGINIVQYHDIAPDCARIISEQQCHQYYVWHHDYETHQQVLKDPSLTDMHPVSYLGEWVYWLNYRLFFVINSSLQDYRNYPPLPLPAAAFIVLLFSSIAAFALTAKTILKRYPYALFLLTIVVLYLLILLSQGWLKYQQTGILQLMNGRYLLPILLPAAALGVMALSVALQRAPRIKPYIAAIAILMFFAGGGVFTFISRSDSSWYWNNHYVVTVNDAVRNTISPILPEGDKIYKTPKWFFN